MSSLMECMKCIKDGKMDEFEKIESKMKPTLEKYTKLMYKDEKEDIYAELRLALLEAVIKMEYYDNEGMIVRYLYTAIKNHFLELYRTSCKQNDNECYINDEEWMGIEGKSEKEIDDSVFLMDINNFLERYTGLRRKVFTFMAINGLGDAEIAKNMNISRQYVNRLRKKLQKDLMVYMD